MMDIDFLPGHFIVVGGSYKKRETQGFIKICVGAETKQILGAAILGVGGDEVINVLLDVMYAKAPYTVVQRAMHIHPTVAEYLPDVLSRLDLLRRETTVRNRVNIAWNRDCPSRQDPIPSYGQYHIQLLSF